MIVRERQPAAKEVVSALQKFDEDEDSLFSSVEGSSHVQDAMEMLEEHHPKFVLALKSRKFTKLELRNVLLLDNQLTFNLCCNKTFASKIIEAANALLMTSNGSGLKITKKCKIPGYVFSLVQQESNHKYHLPQEPYQVLSSNQ